MAKRVVRPIRIEGNIAYIPLTLGYEAVIDAADVPLVDGVNWWARPKAKTVDAVRRSRAVTIYLHRVIISAPHQGKEVDHIDRNGLNNRRSNLRPVTSAQNKWNVGLRSDNTSGLKGAFWDKSRQNWIARISVNNVGKHLGRFDTAEAAHAAYAAEAKRIRGDFMVT